MAVYFDSLFGMWNAGGLMVSCPNDCSTAEPAVRGHQSKTRVDAAAALALKPRRHRVRRDRPGHRDRGMAGSGPASDQGRWPSRKVRGAKVWLDGGQQYPPPVRPGRPAWPRLLAKDPRPLTMIGGMLGPKIRWGSFGVSGRTRWSSHRLRTQPKAASAAVWRSARGTPGSTPGRRQYCRRPGTGFYRFEGPAQQV